MRLRGLILPQSVSWLTTTGILVMWSEPANVGSPLNATPTHAEGSGSRFPGFWLNAARAKPIPRYSRSTGENPDGREPRPHDFDPS